MNTKLKILYGLLAIGLIYTVWSTNSDQQSETHSAKIWGTHVNEQGQLDVMGVILGQSNLKEAEKALHTQSERALFIQLDEKGKPLSESVEAFFPTSPDRAKLVIELAADSDIIDRIKKRSYKAQAFPSGSMKIEIAPQELPDVEKLTAKSLTYIPPISLEPEMMEQQFGKPNQHMRDLDGNLHMLYPQIGLDAVIPASGKSLLQFVPPSEFERLTKLINLPEQTEAPQ